MLTHDPCNRNIPDVLIHKVDHKEKLYRRYRQNYFCHVQFLTAPWGLHRQATVTINSIIRSFN